MIVYNQSSWLFLPNYLSARVITRSLIFSIIHATINLLISITYQKRWITYPVGNTIFKDLLGIFSFFFFMGLGFRLNSAYSNWNIGVDLVLKINNQSIHFINSLFTILSVNDKSYNINNVLLNQFKAMIIKYTNCLFEDQVNDIIRRKSKTEIFKLDANHYLIHSESSCNSSSSKECIEKYLPLQKNLLEMESFIKKSLSTNTNEYYTDSDYSYLINVFDVLIQCRHSLYKIQNIPPVCIYNQLFDFYMYSYLILYGLSIVPNAGLYSCIWCFIWGFIVSLALYVAKEIDSPFGSDKNDIDIPTILNNMKKDINLITFLLK